MKTPKKLLIALAILIAGGALALSLVVKSRNQTAAEAEARQALEKLGALVTMDSNKRHVQGVALLPGTKQEDLEKVVQLTAQLPWLEVLRLASNGITDEHLAQIGDFSSLKMLGLNKTDISDAGLGHLRNLNKLQALYLLGTRITPQGLEAVGHLSGLEILDLSETGLEGDLTSLLPLDRLSHLVLSGVPLSDDAVSALLQLKSLSRLTIHGSAISDEAASKLEQTDLKIDK
jgi:internalin A